MGAKKGNGGVARELENQSSLSRPDVPWVQKTRRGKDCPSNQTCRFYLRQATRRSELVEPRGLEFKVQLAPKRACFPQRSAMWARETEG